MQASAAEEAATKEANSNDNTNTFLLSIINFLLSITFSVLQMSAEEAAAAEAKAAAAREKALTSGAGGVSCLRRHRWTCN